MARVRLGLRGKEQPAKITAVANVSGHGCAVGVNLHVTNGALPDMWAAFATDDPMTAILALKLVEALVGGARVEVARDGAASAAKHGIVNLRYGHYRVEPSEPFRWGNFTGEAADVICAIAPDDANTSSQESLVGALIASLARG